MYSEKKFKFWAVMEIIKKWFIVLVFSIIGLAGGFFISEFVVDVLNELVVYRVAIIAGLTFLGFFIGLLFTSSAERNVQDAYWKIAVMKNLDEICETLDAIKKDNSTSTISRKNIVNTVEQNNTNTTQAK